MRCFAFIILLSLAAGCPTTTQPVVEELPVALVASDRSGHWLDRPFPSDELRRSDGTVDWTILPPSPSPIGERIMEGWSGQASIASAGFSHQPAIYFRFSSQPALQDGDVGITAADGTEVPIEWQWIDDPAGDPFLTSNLLVVMPEHTAPLSSGGRYVGWVSDRVAQAADGWTAPEGAPDAVAVATAFTVQDSLGQLRALVAAVDEELAERPELLTPSAWRRVVSLGYGQGETPSGEPSTVATVTYENGETDPTYLAPDPDGPSWTVELGEDWPHEVWEARIQTLAFQPEEGRPWAGSGLGLLADFDRRNEGWIPFVDGQITSEPYAEEMRIVVQVPRVGSGPFPVVTWDHGTGGHAYNAVGRANPDDLSGEVASAFSEAVIVSRDQPLYGQRYPLIDEGFGASLGFYNIGNLPAFRDNQRQAAADHRVLHRFVSEVLPDQLEVSLNGEGAFGHSLGSVTAHGGLAGQQGSGATRALMSGTGGYLSYYVLETGLLGGDNDVVVGLAPLLGFTEEQLAESTPPELIAALAGIPETAWPLMGRHHPVMQLFATIMDPSDPMSFARDQVVPETFILGLDDLQVPERTTRWLAEAQPEVEIVECAPRGTYDGHYCTFREPESFAAIRDWVDRL